MDSYQQILLVGLYNRAKKTNYSIKEYEDFIDKKFNGFISPHISDFIDKSDSLPEFLEKVERWEGNEFGLFVYNLNNDEIRRCYYFLEKQIALTKAKHLDLADYEYAELWKQDERGDFGVSGEPLWCSDKSGYKKE